MRLAVVCAIACSVAEVQAIGRGGTPSPPKVGKTGRLIVQRAPNFGKDLVLRLSIDGKRIADIPRNQHYGDLVSAGHHTVTVLALPSNRVRRATSIRLTVKSGHVYIYTAAWDRDRLILRPSDLYSPTRRVNASESKR